MVTRSIILAALAIIAPAAAWAQSPETSVYALGAGITPLSQAKIALPGGTVPLQQAFASAGPARGLRVQAFGDSEDNFNAGNALGNEGLPAGNQFLAYSQGGNLVQAMHFLGGELNFDLSLGYGPVLYQAGPEKIQIATGGGGQYVTPPTGASIPACPTTTLGAPVMSNGVVVSVPILAVTAACATGQPVVFTGGVGLGATAYVLSGAGGTISSPGATTAQMLDFLPDALALPVDLIAMHGGTNDYGSLITPAQTEANLATIWSGFLSKGISVAYFSLLPRNATGAPAQQLQLAQVNQWARRWIANKMASPRPPGSGGIMFVDREAECTDQASATGAFLASCSTDGLHEGNGGPWVLGYKLAQSLRPLIGNYGLYISTSQADTYDATNNPGGAMLPSFYTPTGGTAYSPCTGTVPAGWALQRYSGSGSGTPCVGSTENPRTDLLSGSRFVATTTTGAGSNFEQFSLNNGGPSPSTMGLTLGTDRVYAEAYLSISGIANMSQLVLQMSCGGSSGTLALAADQTVPPNSGTLYGPADNVPLLMRTPPIVCPVGTTSVLSQVQWIMNGSGAAGSATATIKVSNFTVRKAT